MTKCRNFRMMPLKGGDDCATVVYAKLAVVFGILILWNASPVLAQTETVDGHSLLAKHANDVINIDTEELQAKINTESDIVLIDVRTASEIDTLGGTIDAGSKNINLNRGWLEFRIFEEVPDKSTPIVVYCGINQRSPLAAVTLQSMGYKNVVNYADGFFAWRDAGLPTKQSDNAPGTMLYNMPVKVADGIWSSIGATAPATYENSGHNNNLSFIITDDGVVVVNAGDNYLLAQSLHAEIRKLTDQPVKYVILENGQGHAMLGTGYWQEQGAQVIAHVDAVTEIEHRGAVILERMRTRNRDKAMGTELAIPDKIITENTVLEVGGERIEILHLGPTHSPGDIVVWLPDRQLVIAGDMAFHERLLPIFEDTDTAGWVDTWHKFAALNATTVIPGHGGPTDMAEVTKYTLDYLVFLRAAVADVLDSGGGLIEAYKIDQSAYRHLDTYNELAGLNVDRVFRAMEFE